MTLVNVPKSIAFFETTLATAISSTATSFTLTSAEDKDGTTLADDTYAFVIDEGSSNEEIVVCRCIGTAATEALRGVSVRTGNTEVTALKKSHRRGASVKMTTGPVVPIVTNIMRGDGALDFQPVADGDICTKKYADDIASAGAADANATTKGISEQSTEAEINADTETGSTSAKLFVDPATLATSKYGLVVNGMTGAVLPYAGATAPTGWLLCYGQAVSRTTYADLFALISDDYGVGDGSTTFNVPDLRGRVIAGLDNLGGVSADVVTDTDADTLGGTDGEEDHVLTEAELAAHTHDQFSSAGDGYDVNLIDVTNDSNGSLTAATNGAIRDAGSDTAHNTMQPTIFMSYIIKT